MVFSFLLLKKIQNHEKPPPPLTVSVLLRGANDREAELLADGGVGGQPVGRGHELDKVDSACIFFLVLFFTSRVSFFLLLFVFSLCLFQNKGRTIVRAEDQRLPEPVEGRLELGAENVDEVRPLFCFRFFC